MNITIKDIAQKTGLSPATVSKYLNQKKISSENALKIKEAIQDFNYIPNRHAQALRSKKGNTIALILLHFNDYLGASALGEIENFFSSLGYSTMLLSFNPMEKEMTRMANFLSSLPVCGCIFLDERIADTNLLELLKAREIPFVFMDSRPGNMEVDQVTSAHYEGVSFAARYLIQKGHRNFGLICGPKNHYTTMQRVSAFEDACNKWQLPDTRTKILYGDYNIASGIDMFSQLMEENPRPSVIFSLNFYYMISITQHLTKYRLRVPEELSLITFDDSQLFAAYNPPITVVRQNLKALGVETAKLLYRRIQGDYLDYPCKIIIPTEFIERASVGRFKG